MNDVNTGEAQVDRQNVGNHDRPCPMCARESLDVRSVKVIERENQVFNIVRCAGCGFVFVRNPRASTVSEEEATAQEVAILDPMRRHYQTKNLLDWYFQSEKSASTRVVEVGAGTGPLPRTLRDDPGKKYSYLGFEPSEGRAEACRQQGINVVNDFFSSDTLEYAADAIIIDNVLEHVADPRSVLKQASNALRSKGLLVVIVPNFRDVRRFVPSWRKRHHWQPRCHINYFTSEDLSHLFNEFGFSFHHFGFGTLDFPKDLVYLPKIILDKLFVPIAGLYCYGIKQKVHRKLEQPGE